MLIDEPTPLHMASDDVREEAWRHVHALCETCSWDGRDTDVCLEGGHPDDRLCGGDVELALVVDGLPVCCPCAVATVVFRLLETLGLVLPGCDLCGAADGEHRRACPAGRS